MLRSDYQKTDALRLVMRLAVMFKELRKASFCPKMFSMISEISVSAQAR
jgi:hypothetical protein